MDEVGTRVVVVRRTPEQKRAYLAALEDPAAAGDEADRWRALGPELRDLVRRITLGDAAILECGG